MRAHCNLAANRRAWLRCIAATIVALLVGGAAPEYNIKAGYLLLFAKYVEWPAHAFEGDSDPVVFAVIGRDPFEGALEATLVGQRINGRAVRVVYANDLTSPMRAHVAFIAAANPQDEARWLRLLIDQPTLTVVESETSFDIGAIVRFVREYDRIRFDVDVGAASRSSLQIRTPMLVSARTVRNTKSTRSKKTVETQGAVP